MEFVHKKGYLIVRDKGERRDFSSSAQHTKLVSEEAKKQGVSHVILDYRKLVFTVSLNEAFNLVRYYENKVPIFKKLVLAVVVNSTNIEISEFWESICNKRGYNYKSFTDFDKAEEWLQAQMKIHA